MVTLPASQGLCDPAVWPSNAVSSIVCGAGGLGACGPPPPGSGVRSEGQEMISLHYIRLYLKGTKEGHFYHLGHNMGHHLFGTMVFRGIVYSIWHYFYRYDTNIYEVQYLGYCAALQVL